MPLCTQKSIPQDFGYFPRNSSKIFDDENFAMLRCRAGILHSATCSHSELGLNLGVDVSPCDLLIPESLWLLAGVLGKGVKKRQLTTPLLPLILDFQ